MSFKEAQWAYDNMCEPDYPDENPAVLEMCRVQHDEDYLESAFESEEVGTYLMRLATNEQPDDGVVQGFLAFIRNHYENSLAEFTSENYLKNEKKWLDAQSVY